MDVLAQIVIPGSCKGLCGWLVIVSAMVLFPGTVWLLTSAVFGNRMGYLISATAFFGFMVILSALWTFGAPETPRYTGPKGELPAWKPLAAGQEVDSRTLPVVGQYPADPWVTPEDSGDLKVEAEPATLAFQEFAAEEAAAQLVESGIEAEEVPSTEFTVEELRFTEIDERPFAMARVFYSAGGPEIVVVGYKDPGNEPLPSYLALAASVIGFAVHLPFLDRAERKRKEILTGGDQPPFRGPA